MNHLIPERTHGHPAFGGFDKAQSLRSVKIVNRGRRPFPQQHKQRGQQFVADRILQSARSADERVNPFGQIRIAFQIDLLLQRQTLASALTRTSTLRPCIARDTRADEFMLVSDVFDPELRLRSLTLTAQATIAG